MKEENLLNFQYGKLLTNKMKIKDYVSESYKFKSVKIELCEIEVLGLLLIDYDNYYNEALNEEESNIIKKYIGCLDNNDYEKKIYNTKDIYKIYEIGNNKKINDELNKLIAIKYAEYNNLVNIFNPIGIDIIKKIV